MSVEWNYCPASHAAPLARWTQLASHVWERDDGLLIEWQRPDALDIELRSLLVSA